MYLKALAAFLESSDRAFMRNDSANKPIPVNKLKNSIPKNPSIGTLKYKETKKSTANIANPKKIKSRKK